MLKVEEVRNAKPPKFEEVQAELKSLMTQEAIVEIIKQLRSTAHVELFDKDGKPMPKETEKKAEDATPVAPAAAETPAAPAAAPEEKK